MLSTISRMKILGVSLLLLSAAIGGGATEGIALLLSVLPFRLTTVEVDRAASVDLSEDGLILSPQDNHGGWVNPEDLPPMPQCISQQDQAVWLSTMTRCTSKICIRHFGIICTHHQWLTQLSCLNTAFSPEVIQGYSEYCSRSVLAKAQLYQWVRKITGRTWLVDVGDANELQGLSPASLTEGYASFDVRRAAPRCLTQSTSAPSGESFGHVMASCMFTDTTQHTGNPARPWEYNESQGSMVALDSETVGYNLTLHSIPAGTYFDKACFCGAFAMDLAKEPCRDLVQLDFTKERLWMNATCGPESLPYYWQKGLKTTGYSYIPSEDWQWPKCVDDMPQQVTGLVEQCATEACDRDADGYCKVKRVVERDCFCRDIRYESCGGSCHIFETRMDYVKWLHTLCGSVRGWHGLPVGWWRLAAPTLLEMLPWKWTVKPNFASITRAGSSNPTQQCASNEWKLGSLALINLAPILAKFLCRGKGLKRIARRYLWAPPQGSFVFAGTVIAALQIFANLINAYLVQITPGYDNVPIIPLMLLWCTMPRLAWIPVLIIGVQPTESMSAPASASLLFGESILQLISSCFMVSIIVYGLQHGFYSDGLKDAERGTAAEVMYSAALIGPAVIVLLLMLWTPTLLKIDCLIGSDSDTTHERKRSEQTPSTIIEDPLVRSDEYCARIRDKTAYPSPFMGRAFKETMPINMEGECYTAYGTVPAMKQNDQNCEEALANKRALTTLLLLLLWAAQWLFWGGFIVLSSEE